ncbi:MAG: autotransporter outer membrane beta-barrel domain-containing protein [Paracoccus sp. (in: a-proteobacteria)]
MSFLNKRGGRLTKWKGKVASLAALTASVAISAISVPSLAKAQCVTAGGTATCSGTIALSGGELFDWTPTTSLTFSSDLHATSAGGGLFQFIGSSAAPATDLVMTVEQGARFEFSGVSDVLRLVAGTDQTSRIILSGTIINTDRRGVRHQINGVGPVGAHNVVLSCGGLIDTEQTGIWTRTNPTAGDGQISFQIDGTIRNATVRGIHISQNSEADIPVTVNIGATGVMESGQQALYIGNNSTTAATIVNIDGRVVGGWNMAAIGGANGNFGPTAAVTIQAEDGGSQIRIGQGGQVSSLNDLVINDLDAGLNTDTSAEMELVNDGTITGYVLLDGGNDTFTNRSANSWNIRNFAATTGPNTRDTENVALSDFGAGADTFTNTANGVVRLLTVGDQTGFSTDTTDDAQPTAWLTSGVTEYFPDAVLVSQPSAMRSITETGVEQTHLVNLERFENAGLLTMADAETGGTGPVAGDVFVITGNATANGTSGGGVYVSNGGRVHIDTVLNDGTVDETDLLVVDRASVGSGPTQIVVTSARPGNAASTDLNGNGRADAGEGILVIQSLENGSDAGAFALASPVEEGVFVYDLDQTDGQNWYLQTVVGALSSVARVYEAVPHILMTELPTLEQRVGQRLWNNSPTSSEKGLQKGSWVRLTGEFSKTDLNSGTSFDSNEWQLQAGLDLPLETGRSGQWVLGATAQIGSVDASVSGSHGGGSIDSESFGIGATATWYGNQGTYLDFQGQVNWHDSSLASANVGKLSDGETSQSYAFSVEAGHRFTVSETGGLTPQAQLTWSKLDGAEFTDDAGNGVDLGSNSRVIGRLGLAYDHQVQTGVNEYRKLYVIGNILHDFSGSNEVTVGGAVLKSERDSTWAELRIGGSIAWDKSKSLYSEASYRTSLDNPSSDNRSVMFNAGFRWEF